MRRYEDVSTKSETNQKPKQELEPTELKLLHLTKCPAGTGKTVKQLRGKTRRLIKDVRREVKKLVAEGYLEEFIQRRSPAFRVTEKGRKAAGLLFGRELQLVQVAAEEWAVRMDQFAGVVNRPQAEVEGEIEDLIQRGLLESRTILNGELPAVWPSVKGLAETGYHWKQYRPLPTLHLWPQQFSLVNIRKLLVAEFEDGSWECGRSRALGHARREGNVAAGVLHYGDRSSVGVMVQLSGAELKRMSKDVRKLAKEHTEVRCYCDVEGRAVIEEAIRKTGVKNVTVLDIPGELIYRSYRTRIPFTRNQVQAA
jgi:DNA-binding MarR family transcriptional regulator